ncbi:uncharacterized protein vers [Drosophila kikkawai]|uniref:Uncharacterized protein vers n=1 Tax=Drosophila kikkawai TaxID=30033 RepID=A0A6P4IBH2_DROKI|nr:uncharacterized protein LOC108073853 [Drosophila kikkawai]
MRSRSNGGPASAPATTRSARSSLNTAGTPRNATRSSGQIKAIADSRHSSQKRPLPPKSEYEKFYENVFLGNDEPTAETPSAGTKRPLHALLNDEDSQAELGRPSKIPAGRKTSEALISPKKQIIAVKDEVIRQINGPSSPVKTPVTVATAKSIHQKRYDRFDQLYNKTERHIWKDDAIQMLLQLWAQHIRGLRGTMKNTVIYKEMEKQMSRFGPSHFEIKTKMDNMSRKFRLEAEKFRETGVPSTWAYFHRLQSLLIGTKGVDVFEDMMFDTGSTHFYDQDESEADDMESLRGEYLAEDSSANDRHFEEEREEEDADNKHNIDFLANEKFQESLRSPSPAGPEADEYGEDEEVEEEEVEADEQFNEREETPEAESTVEDHAKRKKETKRRTDRMLEIEEEKLVIEREKLKVMKEALQELSAFHKDLMKLIKTRK